MEAHHKRFTLQTFRTQNYIQAQEACEYSYKNKRASLIMGERGFGRTKAVETFAAKRSGVVLCRTHHARGARLFFEICLAIDTRFNGPFIKSYCHDYEKHIVSCLKNPDSNTRLLILDDFAIKEWELLTPIMKSLNNIGWVIVTTHDEVQYQTVLRDDFREVFLKRMFNINQLSKPSMAEIKAIATSKGVTDFKQLIGANSFLDLKIKLKSLWEANHKSIETKNAEL
ncbi:MAG: hypothetical protein KF775_02235 [Cyclobacteriaceae bacterium]|nr:hypothetical protein [Cyclobacteriaceae bacterium]